MKGEVGEGQDWDRLREMRKKVEEIDRLVLDLKALGRGMPVIEKNACSILSFLYVLKFGISDLAEIIDDGRC